MAKVKNITNLSLSFNLTKVNLKTVNLNLKVVNKTNLVDVEVEDVEEVDELDKVDGAGCVIEGA
jgi:hypothetical protein